MSEAARPMTLGRWLRRHSLALVAVLGSAAGVAYAARWHGRTEPAAPPPHQPVHAVSVAMPVPVPEATARLQPPPEPPRDNVQDTVQIVLVLDTSSSMDGLLNQARSHLWNMVDQMGRMTRVVDGKTRGVRIELALFEYGNDTLSAKTGFIRQVIPFTSDLDKVSEKLQALFTNGGSEYVGQAITKAATSLAWSTDPDAMKFVFVAGNEEFDQGPISAAKAMQAAAKRDINVQLIYCGGKEPSWEAAAALAKSDLMTIDQDQVAQHIPSPQDADILALGDQLNATYMAYGADGEASAARQMTADVSSAKLSPKVALERAQLKSKASYHNENWDVIDAVDRDAKFLENTKEEQLPAQLRGKTLAEKQQLVAKNTAARAELKAKIAKLEAERASFLETERAKQTGAEAQSLETELMKTTKQVAGKKGYKF